MKLCQQGFALIESMIAVVVFALLLIALLNYSQYITLNFNQIYQGVAAIRNLHSSLETQCNSKEKTSPTNIAAVNSDIGSFNWQREEAHLLKTRYCTESTVS